MTLKASVHGDFLLSIETVHSPMEEHHFPLCLSILLRVMCKQQLTHSPVITGVSFSAREPLSVVIGLLAAEGET